MKHNGECLKDPIAKDVCESLYMEKCDDIFKLQEAIRAVNTLAGENKEINKICSDILCETGAE